MPTNGRVKSVDTAFDMLEVLRDKDGSSVTELAAECDCAKSTMHAHLRTLRNRGYVVRNADGYHLGLQFLDLGNSARSRFQLVQAARPEIDQLVEETGERIQLMVEEQGMGTYVYQSRSESAISTDSHTGTRVNLHSTAVGKAYLAFLPRERVEEILDRRGLPAKTEHTTIDREALYAELDEVKERGVAFNDEEKIEGMRAVGAPITGEDNVAIAAFSLSSPTTRLNGERYRTEIPQKLQNIARVISIKSTYSQ